MPTKCAMALCIVKICKMCSRISIIISWSVLLKPFLFRSICKTCKGKEIPQCNFKQTIWKVKIMLLFHTSVITSIFPEIIFLATYLYIISNNWNTKKRTVNICEDVFLIFSSQLRPILFSTYQAKLEFYMKGMQNIIHVIHLYSCTIHFVVHLLKFLDYVSWNLK